MDTAKLFKLGRPTFYISLLNTSDFADLGYTLVNDHPEYAIKTIRGKHSKTLTDFYSEISAALQFPFYFGNNWDAFNDVITDMGWMRASRYLLLIPDADQFLADAKDKDFQNFLEIVRDNNESSLDDQGNAPEDAIAMHVVFQVAEPQSVTFQQRLEAAGVQSEYIS